MQILQVFMVSFIVLAMIFMFLWSTLIDPLFYSPYLYHKYVVSKFSKQNTFDLLKDTAAISQKIRSIPIVNLYKEQIENVEDTLGFEVLPIEFDQSIIDSELNHIEYSLLKDEIKSFSQ